MSSLLSAATSPSTSASTTTTSTATSLLTLPLELRQQIWVYAFADLRLRPLPTPTAFVSGLCTVCSSVESESETASSLLGPNPAAPVPSLGLPLSARIGVQDTSSLFRTYFQPLMTCRRLYSEASPVFFQSLCLDITDSATLDSIRKHSPLTLRQKIKRVDLTVHLTDDTRLGWHMALTDLYPGLFPGLTDLEVNNHMRSPTSYDRLVDAVYLCGPLAKLVRAPLSHSLRTKWAFAYAREEVMFDSPFLGEITTADSIEAHEAVIRDLLRDDGFAVYASIDAGPESGEGGAARPTRGDFEGMTARLLVVARAHEERWLEGLQRVRLGGLTVREVQERMMREAGGGPVRQQQRTGEDTEDDTEEDEDEQEDEGEQEGVWEE